MAILDVDGEKIYLDEVKADPPTDEEINNLIQTVFLQRLSYLVELKIWGQLIDRWNISFTDQDIRLFKKEYYDNLDIHREYMEDQVEHTRVIIQTLKLLLDGVAPEKIYEQYGEQIKYPYEMWKHSFVKDKMTIEKTIAVHEYSYKYAKDLLQKSDDQIKEITIKQSIEFRRPYYGYAMVARKICDSNQVDAGSKLNQEKLLSEDCLVFAADWLTQYMKDHVRVLNPVAQDYAFSVNFYNNLARFDLLKN